MADVIHQSRFKIVQDKRPLRRAYLEGFKDPGGRGRRVNDRHPGRRAGGTPDPLLS
jgi:hypothetical protein